LGESRFAAAAAGFFGTAGELTAGASAVTEGSMNATVLDTDRKGCVVVLLDLLTKPLTASTLLFILMCE
jgi:hypothetical protein